MHFGLTFRQRATWLYAAAIWLAIAVGDLAIGAASVAVIGALGVVLCLTRFLMSARVGVTLTPDAVTIQTMRRRTIPWPAVRSVLVENWWGSSTLVVVEADRRTRLPVPRKSDRKQDPAFDAAAHAIRAWAVAHGGGG